MEGLSSDLISACPSAPEFNCYCYSSENCLAAALKNVATLKAGEKMDVCLNVLLESFFYLITWVN